MNLGVTTTLMAMLVCLWAALGGCKLEPIPTDPPEIDRPSTVDAAAIDETVDDEPRAPESAGMTADAPLPEGWRTRGIGRFSSADRALAVSNAQLTMHLLTPYGDDWVVARDGAQLRSRDRFKVRVELRSAHYVYLLYATDGGPADILYPKNNEPTRLGAGVHELPPPTSEKDELGLNDDPGREALFLVASQKPLAEADPALAKLIDDIEAGHERTLLVTGAEDDEAEPDTPAPKADESRALRGVENEKKKKKKKKRIGKQKRNESVSASEQPVPASAERPPASEGRREDRVNKFLTSRGDSGLRVDRSGIDGNVGDDGVAVLTLEFDHIPR